MSSPKKVKKVRKYLRLMEKKLGRPYNPHRKPLMDQLVFFHLYCFGGSTKGKKVLRAFREEYVDWNEVRVSPLGQLGETISESGITPEVARTVKSFLNEIYNEHNSLEIEFLREDTQENYRKHFNRVNSLAPGAVQFLMLVNKDYNAVPPEQPVKRVSERLGLVTANSTKGKLNKTFRSIIPEKEALRFFLLAIEHGRTICTPESPKCKTCPMEKDCDFADKLKKEKARKTASSKKKTKKKKTVKATKKESASSKKKKRKRKLTRRSRSTKSKAKK